MKKIAIYLTLIFSQIIYSQVETVDYTQNRIEFFRKAETHLKKNDIQRAIELFHASQFYDTISETSILARKKIDSLIPFHQKNILNELKGIWRYGFINPSRKKPILFPKCIEITDNEIAFYNSKKPKQKNLIVKQKIIFTNYDPKNVFCRINAIKLELNEIWEFFPDKNKLSLGYINGKYGNFELDYYSSRNYRKK